MSITEPLREWVRHIGENPHLGYLTEMGGAGLITIADVIDVQYKQAVDKAHADGERNALQQHRSASEDYRRGYEKGKADGFDEGFASADDWLAEHADAMAEHGWVKLPKDADGVPIRIGDKVTEHEDGHTFTVDGFMRWGSDNLWVFERDGIQAQARGCTHVQPDTWERIIEDALGNGGCYTNFDVGRLVARCRALAGEDA